MWQLRQRCAVPCQHASLVAVAMLLRHGTPWSCTVSTSCMQTPDHINSNCIICLIDVFVRFMSKLVSDMYMAVTAPPAHLASICSLGRLRLHCLHAHGGHWVHHCRRRRCVAWLHICLLYSNRYIILTAGSCSARSCADIIAIHTCLVTSHTRTHPPAYAHGHCSIRPEAVLRVAAAPHHWLGCAWCLSHSHLTPWRYVVLYAGTIRRLSRWMHCLVPM